jgi:hypothetical protein
VVLHTKTKGVLVIKKIVVGDITDVSNQRHIILGMNNTLEDLVNRIGRPYVEKLRADLTHPLELGSVLSFRFDDHHLLVCHEIGHGGWHDADRYIRFGLDYLDHAENNKVDEFSIVQIGTGLIGVRDGAIYHSIHAAMTNSHLPMTLFVWDDHVVPLYKKRDELLEMVAYAAWTPDWGRQELDLIAS